MIETTDGLRQATRAGAAPQGGHAAGDTGSLAARSFLRRVDPRTKLVLSVGASAAAMLPLPQLAGVLAAYVLLVLTARIERHVVMQLRRTAGLLAIVCVADYLWIGAEFAVLITVRLILLVTAFSLFFATTTPDELQTALERVGVPARLAFTLTAAYRFVGLMDSEWRGIIEAQRARGIVVASTSWRAPRQHLANAVALLIPAVVLATQRAWSITEAAAARGFESPNRRASRRLHLSRVDLLLLAAAGSLLAGLLACR